MTIVSHGFTKNIARTAGVLPRIPVVLPRTARFGRDNKFIRSVRDVLLSIYRDNPDALGDFGFEVSDATSAPSAAPAPPKP